MQSKINNDKNTNNINNNNVDRDEILLNNKEIINNLIVENHQKKDKSFISIRELEYIREYEGNLIRLLESCPPNILRAVLKETVIQEEVGDEAMEISEQDEEN